MEQFLLELKHGFKSGFPEDGDVSNLNKYPRSIVRSVTEFVELLKLMTKNVNKGWTAPVLKCPDHIISLFLVPKKNSQDKFRMVRDASYSKSGYVSLNSCIPDDQAHMEVENVQGFARLFARARKGWFGGKDLKAAFRQIHIFPPQIPQYGFCMLSQYLVDGRHPFGTRSAPKICQKIARWVVKIYKAFYIKQIATIQDNTVAYLDDYTVVAKTKKECKLLLDLLGKCFVDLGLMESSSKAFGPVQKDKVFGLIWDVSKGTVSCPQEKIDKIKNLINLVIEYRWITIDVALTLAGWLMHVSQIMTPGKACVKSLICRIYKVSKNLDKRKWVFITDKIANHLKFWSTFVSECVEVPITHVYERPSIQIEISTDASDFGYGICWEGRYIAEILPDWMLTKNIALKEAFAVLCAIHTFGKSFSGKKVLMYVDNMAVVHTVSNKWSKNEWLMAFVYEICALSVEYRFFFWVDWIASLDNVAADALSRFDVARFIEVVPTNRRKCTPVIKKGLRYLSDFELSRFLNI